MELNSVIVIHFNGGENTEGEMEDLTLSMGDIFTLPECGFVSTDRKQFAGWRFEGLTRVYEPGDQVAVDSTEILDQEATVNALWADSAWGVFQTRIIGGNGQTFVLQDNLVAGPTDVALNIPKGYDITIDLNGNYIDRNNRSGETSDQGSAIIIDGTLTLLDSSLGQTGTITGGSSSLRRRHAAFTSHRRSAGSFLEVRQASDDLTLLSALSPFIQKRHPFTDRQGAGG